MQFGTELRGPVGRRLGPGGGKRPGRHDRGQRVGRGLLGAAIPQGGSLSIGWNGDIQ